jgi:GGDEF domain-containing protein
LRSALPPEAVVARLGGDELAVVVPPDLATATGPGARDHRDGRDGGFRREFDEVELDRSFVTGIHRLARLGCDLVQGYLRSPAVPAARFERWCDGRRP